MKSLLSYNKHPRINEFSVKKTGNKATSEDGAMPVVITYSLKTSEISEEDTCSVIFKVGLDGDETPLNLLLELEGTYDVNGAPEKNELQRAAANDAGPVLFTAAADYIAEITRKMEFPPLILPVPEFADHLEDDENEE